MSDSESLKARVDRVRQLYSLNTLPNIVKDGYKDLNTNGRGVSVEFDVRQPPHPYWLNIHGLIDLNTSQSVSFAYPKQDRKAISNVSFKIQPGSLCILVGGNGQVHIIHCASTIRYTTLISYYRARAQYSSLLPASTMPPRGPFGYKTSRFRTFS